MLDVQFNAATCAYLGALQGYIQYRGQIATLNQAVGFDLWGGIPIAFTTFEGAAAAKIGYVQALTASLAEINGFQNLGIAHYNANYLAQASALLQTVSVAGAEDQVAAAGEIADEVNYFGNLYNNGSWTNFLIWLHQREISLIRRGYFNSAAILFRGANLSVGTSPVPDSGVWGKCAFSCGMILNKATTRSGGVA